MRKIVVVTGGFDPLHSGHIEYFREAKKLGDILVVGLNSDEWLARKKGQPFMPWEERASIVGALSDVDRVINFNDIDNSEDKCTVEFQDDKKLRKILFLLLCGLNQHGLRDCIFASNSAVF